MALVVLAMQLCDIMALLLYHLPALLLWVKLLVNTAANISKNTALKWAVKMLLLSWTMQILNLRLMVASGAHLAQRDSAVQRPAVLLFMQRCTTNLRECFYHVHENCD